MSDIQNTVLPTRSLNAWGGDFEVVVCEQCQWRYLIPGSMLPRPCPHCCANLLQVMPNGLPDMPHPFPPELLAPFEVTSQQLRSAIEKFVTGVPYPPEGLNAETLRKKLVRVYLPMWLVDSSINAQWQAEAGFDYEVVSHQEFFDGDANHWNSREVREPRVRWEYRLGRIQRGYQNVLAPALDDHAELEKRLGSFHMQQVLPYDPAQVQDACICLPDHPPQEAWNEAVSAFQKAAAVECQQASSADRLRNFEWKARFDDLNWTLLLLPVYTSAYQDEDGLSHPLLINGQTGATSGMKKASLRRAGRSSLTFFIAAVLIVVLGLLVSSVSVVSSGLADLATFLVLIGFVGMLASSIPILVAWDYNRKQALDDVRVKQAN